MHSIKNKIANLAICLVLYGCSHTNSSQSPSKVNKKPLMHHADLVNKTKSLHRQLNSVVCLDNCNTDALWLKCLENGFLVDAPEENAKILFSKDVKNHLLEWSTQEKDYEYLEQPSHVDANGIVYTREPVKIEVEVTKKSKGYCNGYEYILESQ